MMRFCFVKEIMLHCQMVRAPRLQVDITGIFRMSHISPALVAQIPALVAQCVKGLLPR